MNPILRRGLSGVVLVLCGALVARGGIIWEDRFRIDFTDRADAIAKATWSGEASPDRIELTEGGLGWDGNDPAALLPFRWVQTRPIGVGSSWRPLQALGIRVRLEPALATVKLANGQSFEPSSGSVFVRHSPDAVHWSSWQALSRDRSAGKGPLQRNYVGEVDIPFRDRLDYLRRWQTYRGLDVPWEDDEEALVKWIVDSEPAYFRTHRPFVGYVQFLYEGDFQSGQRLTAFEAELGGAMSGAVSLPRRGSFDQRWHDGPWRCVGPVEAERPAGS